MPMVRKLDSIFGLHNLLKLQVVRGLYFSHFHALFVGKAWLIDWNLKRSCCSYQLYSRSPYSLFTHTLTALLKRFCMDYTAKLSEYLWFQCQVAPLRLSSSHLPLRLRLFGWFLEDAFRDWMTFHIKPVGWLGGGGGGGGGGGFGRTTRIQAMVWANCEWAWSTTHRAQGGGLLYST